MFFNDVQLPEESLTMAEIFKEAGYNTAYIGKWHLDGMGRDAFTPPERRQGFDYWKVLPGQGAYHNPTFIVKDESKVFKKKGGKKITQHLWHSLTKSKGW